VYRHYLFWHGVVAKLLKKWKFFWRDLWKKGRSFYNYLKAFYLFYSIGVDPVIIGKCRSIQESIW
jgi:hypothetical protein